MFFHEGYIICLHWKAHNVLHKRTTRVTAVEQVGFIVHCRKGEGACGEILSEQEYGKEFAAKLDLSYVM